MTSGVYIIAADEVGRFKVGYSEDVLRRFDELRTASPCNLRIHDVLEGAGFETEATIHRLLSAHHVHGEWFDKGGLEKAERHFRVVACAARSVAIVLSENVPADLLDSLTSVLSTAGAKNVANELSNITGQSIMDRRHA